MWEIIEEVIIPVVQIIFAVFSGVLSYDRFKNYYYSPRIKITLWDLGGENRTTIKRQIVFNKKFPFVFIRRTCSMKITDKEFVVVLENHGKSTARGLFFFGWIPETWNVITTKESVLRGGIIKINDWERAVDKLEYGDTEGNQSFRFIGDLPPTHGEYIKFQVTSLTKELELCIVGDNVSHFLISIELSN